MLPFDTTDDELAVLETLQAVPGWPVDSTYDLQMIRALAFAYRTVDLGKEALAWSVWMSEHEQTKKIKYRSRFGNWVKNAERFARDNGGRVERHRGPETEGHGDAVSSEREW